MSHDADNLRGAQGVSIHSGFPNPAADTSLQTIDLNKILIPHSASTYLFRVRGNEWESIGVFDGDTAIVDKSLDPRKNDIVIWWDEIRAQFSISNYNQMPKTAMPWGVITSTIHQFRKAS